MVYHSHFRHGVEVVNLDRIKKDTYQIELRLKPEQSYRFKYLIDNELWENDYAADEYIPNEFGTEDSVVIIGN